MHLHQTLSPDPIFWTGWFGVFAQLVLAWKRRRLAWPCWRHRRWHNIRWRECSAHPLSEYGSKNIPPGCIEMWGRWCWSPSRGPSRIPCHSWPGAAIGWEISGRTEWEWWQWWRWKRCTTSIDGHKLSADAPGQRWGNGSEASWLTDDANVLSLL